MIEKSSIYTDSCDKWLKDVASANSFHLTFFDPPFNQGKEYRHFDDKQTDSSYWQWMTDILGLLRTATVSGGTVYFMQREKNTEFVLRALRESGWQFRNLIIWKKKSSAVPCSHKYGLHYQIIVMATNGNSPRVFNRLRIAPEQPASHKQPRENGVYVTDVWDDIRELTSGYFAGAEAIRGDNGERFHKQQAPLSLLARIILSSSVPGDVVFDPFAGTGTTLIAASLLNRQSVGVEVDPLNSECVQQRINHPRNADVRAINKLYKEYQYTEKLEAIWGEQINLKQASPSIKQTQNQMTLTS